MDVLIQCIFTHDGSEAEIWASRGWAEKYDYDPAGKGWGELGNLAGYGPEEIAEMPQFTLDDLMEYFDQCLGSLNQYLQSASADALDLPVPFLLDADRTLQQVLEMFLMDGLAHMGEIRTLRAMWERRQA